MMMIRVVTRVGHDSRAPIDVEVETARREVARRIGEHVETAALNSAALTSLDVLDSPMEYPFSLPETEDGVTLFVTVWVDRSNAFKALWDIIMAAKTAVREQTRQELDDALAEGAKMLTFLETERGLRPAKPRDLNELGLSWGGGVPEQRRHG